jgi:hypothetical protein
MTATEFCPNGHPYPQYLRVVTIRGKEFSQCRECDRIRAKEKRDLLRGDRPKFKKKKLIEECFRGHPMEGENLYFYETKWGTQRRCRACQDLRHQEKIQSGDRIDPTKSHCLRGHAMEGENVSYNVAGYAVCKQCAVFRTMTYKNANYDEVLESKRRNRRARKDGVNDVAKARILAIYAENLPDDELIRRLREVMPPPEE